MVYPSNAVMFLCKSISRMYCVTYDEDYPLYGKEGGLYVKKSNGIAIAVYSFLIFCIIIVLINVNNVTAVLTFGR